MSKTKFGSTVNVRNKVIWQRAEEFKKFTGTYESVRSIYFRMKESHTPFLQTK